MESERDEASAKKFSLYIARFGGFRNHAQAHSGIRAFATLSQQRTLDASRSEQGRFGALARYPRYRDCAHSRTNHRTPAYFVYHVFMHILSMFPWPVRAIFREGEVSRGSPGTEQ
uniref:Uncharacterized protein n=1 Tax=Anopheles melas TaxID=34690 RepID=A0A182U7T0_9DIPT